MMTPAEVKVSQVAVLDAAIALLEKGFDNSTYFGAVNPDYDPNDDDQDDEIVELGDPGPDVLYVCAIGGVEQAIWQLTGKDVTDARQLLAYIGAPEAAPTAIAESDALLDDTHLVYGEVMGLLNRTAYEFCREQKGRRLENVEQLTCGPDGMVNTLTVFRRAREAAAG